MSKKKKTFDDYAPAKAEISERVQVLAVNAGENDPRRVIRYPVNGCRNYELESDGTLWMQSGPNRTSHNLWNAKEWKTFEDDCKAGLWAKLDTFCKR